MDLNPCKVFLGPAPNHDRWAPGQAVQHPVIIWVHFADLAYAALSCVPAITDTEEVAFTCVTATVTATH